MVLVYSPYLSMGMNIQSKNWLTPEEEDGRLGCGQEGPKPVNYCEQPFTINKVSAGPGSGGWPS